MEALNEIKGLIPDYAKDVRINLDGAIARSSLPAQEALGVALAAGYAAKSPRLVAVFRAALPEVEANAALTAAALFVPPRAGLLEAYEVSPAVNRAENDGPQLIEPLSSQPAAELPEPRAAKRERKKDERQGSLF